MLLLVSLETQGLSKVGRDLTPPKLEKDTIKWKAAAWMQRVV